MSAISRFAKYCTRLRLSRRLSSQLPICLRRTFVTAELGIFSQAAPLKGKNEDAWSVFCGCSSTTIAVADGVSAWNKVGIDPSLFSNRLVSLIAHYAQAIDGTSRATPDPALLLSKAMSHMELDNDIAGSCTICVSVIDNEQRQLVSANLGDCGILVVRDGEVLHKSIEQYQATNIPYQLGINTAKESILFQRPSDATITTLALSDGDLIMLATDGLFDNMWTDQIIERVGPMQTRLPKRRYCLESTAKSLAFIAHQHALEPMRSLPYRPTPYWCKVHGDGEESVDNVLDSNADDVTVCLVHIVGNEALADARR